MSPVKQQAMSDVGKIENTQFFVGVITVNFSGLTRENFTEHTSDLRDSHEYIQKQVWGEQIFTSGRVAGGWIWKQLG